VANRKHFKLSKGVEFIFKDEHGDIHVKELKLKKPGKKKFNPKNYLNNVKIYKIEDDGSVTFPETFEQSFTLRVYYKKSDVTNATPNTLKLGVFDMEDWITYEKKDSNVTDFKIDDPPWIGYFDIKLLEFPDPVIAWGG
jgi:hypothetical protein